MGRFSIEKLARHHHGVDSFNCGQDALNRFLKRFAYSSQQANASQTYLALADDHVIGYTPWWWPRSAPTVHPGA